MKKLEVCIGSACHIKGSYNVINTFLQMIEEYALSDKLELTAVFCLGHCTQAVSVGFEGEIYSVSPENARNFFKTQIFPNTTEQTELKSN
ncbi:hypothetical protein SDC9_109130 [bioreactor metagenome]|uniref:Uncharacterized protein n=1 Tax=bioreactor metagenome TaxID=1076179 RepID=A0A645BKE4_9ZZZZ